MSTSREPRVRLESGGFRAYLTTQFLGAFNDNVFKFAVTTLITYTVIDAGREGVLLGVGQVLFAAPFILLASAAGWLADRWPKDRVMVATKVLEVAVMSTAAVAFYFAHVPTLLFLLLVMGAQSAFFGPAKYGFLAEGVDEGELSRANGVVSMTTFIAIGVGSVAGTWLYDAFDDALHWIGAVCVLFAVLGLGASLRVPRVADGSVAAPFPLNPMPWLGDALRTVRRNRPLLYTIGGIGHFFVVTAAMQLVLFPYGEEVLALEPLGNGGLVAMAITGIGAGSLAVGRLSERRIELGLVPIGAVLMSLAILDLGRGVPAEAAEWSTFARCWRAYTATLVLGFGGGLFIVPLNATLQNEAPASAKGQFIAFGNAVSFVGVLLSGGVITLLRGALELAPDRIALVLGLVSLVGTAMSIKVLPEAFARTCAWLLAHSIYRIRVVGRDRLPPTGGALLLCNHVSWVDWLVLQATTHRPIRFLIHRDYYEWRLVHWLFRLARCIPIASGDDPRQLRESLEAAGREIERGALVAIFAEGSITRTGNLLPLRRGYQKIVSGRDVPIVPVHLDGLWGSLFSAEGGRFFWKVPRAFPYPVTVSFGAALPSDAEPYRVRDAIQRLSTDAWQLRRLSRRPLHVTVLREHRRSWRRRTLFELGRPGLSVGALLARSLALRDALRDRLGDERHVGVMLPPGQAAVAVHFAILFAGRVPINLNYSASHDAVRSAIDQAGLAVVLTSARFLEHVDVPELPGVVDMEQVREEVSKARVLLWAVLGFVLPFRVLERYAVDGERHDMDVPVSVIFSSGTTGTPKGVVLSHHNVLSNVEAIREVVPLEREDCLLGVLPFFHVFGFTGALWFPLLAGIRVAFHANPLDARAVGEVAERFGATLMIGTPTFLQGYVRRVRPRQFGSLRLVITGAEKLRDRVRTAFRSRFGIEPLEGYGCTECSPIVSVNVPDVRSAGVFQRGAKRGTVGLPVPGVSVEVVDPETGAPLPVGTEGELRVRGPNVMLGYLGDEEATREVLVDGAYLTGDIASIDDDGFITITDRISRFSKIAGEMVPHRVIEDAIVEVLGDAEARVVVVGKPSESKGEVLVVFHEDGDLDVDAVVRDLRERELPNLWIPRAENFKALDAIPVLGSGKVDLADLRRRLA